jgi:thymidylate synthase (FAD)
MTEVNKFVPLDFELLYNDTIGYVQLYDASYANESEDQRIWTVTTTASLAYGNEEAKNPEALYERMKSIKHESLWEFVVDTYPLNGIKNSMRNSPTDYENRYSNEQNIKEHKENIACFRVKIPMFVRAQFMRHRAFSYLEMSRRYTKGSKVKFEFWFPEDCPKDIKSLYTEAWQNNYDALCKEYETQIAARFMPQTTYTEFYMMGSTEGLKNFFRLRCDSHAQKEIQSLAFAMLKLLSIHQPELYKKVMP